MYSNCGPISYCFRKKGDICQIFPPHVFTDLMRGSHSNFVSAVVLIKTSTMPLPDRHKSDDMRIRLDMIRSLDGQDRKADRRTDRQTDLP